MTVFLFMNNSFSEPGWTIIITTTANIIGFLLYYYYKLKLIIEYTHAYIEVQKKQKKTKNKQKPTGIPQTP